MKKQNSKDEEWMQQYTYAKNIADTISLDGEEIFALYILDVLAQNSLKLQVSEENIASIAYFRAVSNKVSA
jgi:hypothetical protein